MWWSGNNLGLRSFGSRLTRLLLTPISPRASSCGLNCPAGKIATGSPFRSVSQGLPSEEILSTMRCRLRERREQVILGWGNYAQHFREADELGWGFASPGDWHRRYIEEGNGRNAAMIARFLLFHGLAAVCPDSAAT